MLFCNRISGLGETDNLPVEILVNDPVAPIYRHSGAGLLWIFPVFYDDC